MNLPDISRKIGSYLTLLKKDNDNPEVIAHKINDLLIVADHVPLQLIDSAWDLYAKERGLEA